MALMCSIVADEKSNDWKPHPCALLIDEIRDTLIRSERLLPSSDGQQHNSQAPDVERRGGNWIPTVRSILRTHQHLN